MSFEPASPISIITCQQCQGTGKLPSGQNCSHCDGYGVYATKDSSNLAFNLPDYIDLKTRKFLQRLLLIKRASLLLVALLFILITWNSLAPIY